MKTALITLALFLGLGSLYVMVTHKPAVIDVAEGPNKLLSLELSHKPQISRPATMKSQPFQSFKRPGSFDQVRPQLRDMSRVITWNELDENWDRELHHLLVYLDRDQGEAIFKAYQKEKFRHEISLKQTLQESLNGLSEMNGESGYQELLPPTPVEELERQHSLRMQMVLGDYYDYVLEHRTSYLAQHSGQ